MKSGILNNIFAFFVALAVIANTSVLSVFDVYMPYYPLVIGSGLLIPLISVVKKENLRINSAALLFLILGLASIAFNIIDPFFRPGQRLVVFSVIMAGFGPLINNRTSSQFKETFFRYALCIATVLVAASTIAVFSHEPVTYLVGGTNGLFNHSMMYSPIAGLSAIFCIHMIAQNKATAQRYKRRINYMLLACGIIFSVFGIFISASRGAIGAFFVAVTYYVFARNRFRPFKLFKQCAILSVALLFIIIVNPFRITDNVLSKIESREASESFLANRDVMWKDRIDDFKSSPIIGVGFESMKHTENSVIQYSSGRMETGSSWLSILGSMGILGVAVFFILLVVPIIKIIVRFPHLVFYGTASLFFAIHIMIEGYVFGVGSGLMILLWTTIGLTNYHVKNVARR